MTLTKQQTALLPRRFTFSRIGINYTRALATAYNIDLEQLIALKRAFTYQRRNATVKRKLTWNLTFEQWLDIWVASGHLTDRGNGIGKYMMCRLLDEGAYEIGNVYIATHSQNVRHMHFFRSLKSKPGFNSSMFFIHDSKIMTLRFKDNGDIDGMGEVQC